MRLIDALVVDGTHAMLLEVCEPGTSLSQGLSPTQQDAVVAVLCRLGSSRRRVTRSGLWRACVVSGPTSSTSGAFLLGSDVHPDSVLAAQREPWLVIDPKPYVGDPTYDPLQHMLNFPERLAGDAAASRSAWQTSAASTRPAAVVAVRALRAGVAGTTPPTADRS